MEQNVNFDNESLAYLSTRKDELIESHESYIEDHPEIRQVLNDFISSVLLHKPVSSPLSHTLAKNDVYVYAKEYFYPFNPTPFQYKPLILVGPSGVGKHTLITEALKKWGNLFEKKKSNTTRDRKTIEKGEENFYFVDNDTFQHMVDTN